MLPTNDPCLSFLGSAFHGDEACVLNLGAISRLKSFSTLWWGFFHGDRKHNIGVAYMNRTTRIDKGPYGHIVAVTSQVQFGKSDLPL